MDLPTRPLSKEDIEEIKRIRRAEYGEEISDYQAWAIAFLKALFDDDGISR